MPKAKGPRKNSTEGCHSPRSFGITCAQRYIGLAARAVLDGAFGSHQDRKIFLELALTRIAAADPHLLAGRRWIDFKPGSHHQLGDRIAVRRAQPMRAEIVGDAEGRGLGDAAAADPVGGFEQHCASSERLDAAGGSNAGCARPDDRHVGFGRKRQAAQHGSRRRPGAEGQERPA